MTALAAKKNVRELQSSFAMSHEEGAKDNAVIHQGALLVVAADGFIAPATTATGLVGAGVAQESVDNTGGADGAKKIKFRSGIFKFVKDGTATPVQADVGNLAYAVDDQTIANTDGTGTRSKVGSIYRVESDGVWVAIMLPNAADAA